MLEKPNNIDHNSLFSYDPMSAQKEHDKNVSVFMKGMCITQKKIVSKIFKCFQMYIVKFLKTAYLT